MQRALGNTYQIDARDERSGLTEFLTALDETHCTIDFEILRHQRIWPNIASHDESHKFVEPLSLPRNLVLWVLRPKKEENLDVKVNVKVRFILCLTALTSCS